MNEVRNNSYGYGGESTIGKPVTFGTFGADQAPAYDYNDNAPLRLSVHALNGQVNYGYGPTPGEGSVALSVQNDPPVFAASPFHPDPYQLNEGGRPGSYGYDADYGGHSSPALFAGQSNAGFEDERNGNETSRPNSFGVHDNPYSSVDPYNGSQLHAEDPYDNDVHYDNQSPNPLTRWAPLHAEDNVTSEV